MKPRKFEDTTKADDDSADVPDDDSEHDWSSNFINTGASQRGINTSSTNLFNRTQVVQIDEIFSNQPTRNSKLEEDDEVTISNTPKFQSKNATPTKITLV